MKFFLVLFGNSPVCLHELRKRKGKKKGEPRGLPLWRRPRFGSGIHPKSLQRACGVLAGSSGSSRPGPLLLLSVNRANAGRLKKGEEALPVSPRPSLVSTARQRTWGLAAAAA